MTIERTGIPSSRQSLSVRSPEPVLRISNELPVFLFPLIEIDQPIPLIAEEISKDKIYGKDHIHRRKSYSRCFR